MKRLILLAMLGFAFSIAPTAKAQVNVSINIGSQPQWGPRGYDHVDYYYMPDIESYYYVPTRQFVYLSENRWIHSRSLPNRYRNYNLYSGRKYVINAPHPYRSHETYRIKYSRHGSWKQDKHHKKYYSKQYRGHNGHRDDDRGYNNRNNRRDQHRDHDRRDNGKRHSDNRGSRN